ncbi:MAG: tRNA (adenosine(37)-N6)-threonylcarbamoyltransferase complex ATPase subunit type 1 TsaE [Trichocoleus desertorum ATA4-8-CV12]|jgi:tRNA threonylcarbamoyladenosine biosynthesis protein TsaE|nr:tRNA (adenosine(37)-N6)-threonylcarbamoyltransferase complex ATPase subunit type 1 TsaE [Trichocoleus desertorum ATA4-8-CV12]
MAVESLTFVLPDAAATRSLGLTLGQALPAGSTLLLEGDLGSGKTTLVQGLGAGLGIADTIDSPTFTLINEYMEGRLPLYHLDLYRLQSTEVAPLNLESYWEGIDYPLGIMAIEWAERLPYLPESYLQVHLRYQSGAGGGKVGNEAIANPPVFSGRYVELIGVGEFDLEFLQNLAVG